MPPPPGGGPERLRRRPAQAGADPGQLGPWAAAGMSRMAPPAPPGPGAPSPQQMADQAAELIRTVTQGALSSPEALLERARRAGLAVAPLLVEPPYSRETYRGRRITL